MKEIGVEGVELGGESLEVFEVEIMLDFVFGVFFK